MLRSPRARVVALVVLLAALFGLLVWHGTLTPAPAMGAYPGNEELGTGYDRYLGDRVALAGRIVATDPVVLEAPYGIDKTLRVRVVGLDSSVTVREGTWFRLYGVVEPNNTIRALNAFAVPQRGLWYTYGISFVAGLWVLGRIVRHWRVDTDAWALTRRERPWRPWARDRSGPRGGDRDA